MSWSIRRVLGGTPVSATAAAEGIGAQDRLLPTGRLEAFSDGVFAIAITLLVIELHVPTGHESLVKGLEHEWPRYLGYFVSFAFIGGVWIAHCNMTRFLKAAAPDLMRLNLMLLLFVSFLPFTTAIAATHLFASNLSFHEVTVSIPTERVAVVLFGLNLTLAALMLYLMLKHAGRTSDVAADDLAEEELAVFAAQRRSALILQASATVVGAFLPLLAVVFYLALAIFYVIDPVRLMHTRSLCRARLEGKSADNLRCGGGPAARQTGHGYPEAVRRDHGRDWFCAPTVSERTIRSWQTGMPHGFHKGGSNLKEPVITNATQPPQKVLLSPVQPGLRAITTSVSPGQSQKIPSAERFASSSRTSPAKSSRRSPNRWGAADEREK